MARLACFAVSHQRIPTFFLSSAAHWSAVSHPLRTEICEYLAATGPLSIVELARLVQKPADSLYHHIKKLQSAGLVRLARTRATGKTSEAIFDVVAESFVPEFDAESGRNVDAVGDLLEASGVVAQKFACNSLRYSGREHRGLSAFRLDVTHLCDTKLARVKNLLSELHQIIKEGRATRQGRLFAMMYLLAPIITSSRARREELDPSPTPPRTSPRRRRKAAHTAK